MLPHQRHAEQKQHHAAQQRPDLLHPPLAPLNGGYERGAKKCPEDARMSAEQLRRSKTSCIPNVVRKEAFHLFHKGLSKEVLIEASKELIEEYRVVVKQ